MNVPLAALLAIALLAGSDEDVAKRLHVRFAPYDLMVPSCRDVVAREPEPGSATFHYAFEVSDEHWLGPRRRTGKLTFWLDDIVIRSPRIISWPGMTDADRERAATLRRAVEHHEIGHVRVAEAVRDALNAEEPIIAPDLAAFAATAEARGRLGFERFTREEHAYDALTDHGRKQHAAPGELNGPDSTLLCPVPERVREG